MRTLKPGSVPGKTELAQAIEQLAENGFQWVEQLSDETEPTPDEVPDASPARNSRKTRHFQLQEIRHAHPVGMILERLDKQNVSLLLLPRRRDEKSTSPDFAIERQLFREAPCLVVQLRVAGGDKPVWHQSLLVAAGDGPHTNVTLRLASRLAAATDSRLTAMYVEPNVDDVAELVGQTILDRIVRRALKADADQVLTKVVMSHNPTTAIERMAEQEQDLLLLGATRLNPKPQVRHHALLLFFQHSVDTARGRRGAGKEQGVGSARLPHPHRRLLESRAPIHGPLPPPAPVPKPRAAGCASFAIALTRVCIYRSVGRPGCRPQACPSRLQARSG